MLLIMTRSETERRVEKASKGGKKENDLEEEEKEGGREEDKEEGDSRWVQLMKKESIGKRKKGKEKMRKTRAKEDEARDGGERLLLAGTFILI